MKILLLGLLAVLSLPPAAYDQNSVPTVNGLHLGDSYRQVVSILGNGEAFGFSQPSTLTRTVNLRFPGQYFYFDSETGFHNNGQR
ncbi:RHS repeat-associated core domain-containing protein [Methylosarcina fibrata]|uniref:hypothetical protein n=1 Tax=Methylosarcina fibrata TaxID=105972 RepID=UPI0005262773|nr:hypothetical protein [Methylosarcina fibrata]